MTILDTLTHCFKCFFHLWGGGIWCYGCGTYMHIKCSGLSTKNDHHLNSICKHCGETAKIDPHETTKIGSTTAYETLLETCNFRQNFWNHQKELLRKIYNEIFHWKPIFFTMSKIEVGFNIANVMNIILPSTLENGPQTECAMICLMIIPHLLLARTKSGNDAKITKTLSRRLDLWIRSEFNKLLVEIKVLQVRLKKLNGKLKVNEFKAFDKLMVSGEISNALRCLSDNANDGVLSISDKMTVKRKKLHRTWSSAKKAST